MKLCPRCHTRKPLDAFNRKRASKDGRQDSCRTCKNKLRREHHFLYPEKTRENNRRQKKIIQEEVKKFYQKHPERKKAYSCLRRALKKGLLKKRPCEVPDCGLEKVHAHHQDYSKPLEVIWLCPRHHKWLHYGLLILPKREKSKVEGEVYAW